nr:MAG: hypothetical protein [Bacteriophage sp.]
MNAKGFLFVMLLVMSIYAASSCVAMAGNVERVHLDAYDVPLATPDGQIAPACVIDLHKNHALTTVAFVGVCEDILPRFKENLEHDGTTTIVTLSINGHNINLT